MSNPPASATHRALADGPAATDGAAAAEKRIRHEQLALVFELTPTPLLLSLPFVALVCALAYGDAPTAAVVGWMLVRLTLTVARTAQVHRFKADRSAADRNGQWTLYYAAGSIADGLSWAAIVWLFMDTARPAVQTMLLASVVGIASLGLFTTHSHKRLSMVFQCAVLLPMMIHFARLGGLDGWGLVGCGLIYLTVLIMEAVRAEARYLDALRLRDANAAIAEERALALARAQHSDRAKSRFIAAVSHELRTPLNGILGITQLLQTRPDAQPMRNELEVMRRSGQHLHRVISDLLDISQVEHGTLRIQRTPVVLADTVRDVVALLQPMALERSVGLQLALAPGLPKVVLADAARIKQVLHNLLGNALKHTDHGMVVLSVSALVPTLQFTVRDSGRGIASDQLASIFEPFVQGGHDAESNGERGGIGLGLTIARQLARAMGGDITVSSTLGEGSSFVFECHAPSVDMQPSSLADPSGTVPRFSGRVLVVDDNEVNALVAVGMLERMGLSVMRASDGIEALEAMRTSHFDAVLMDLHMPRLDGIEATRRWRAEERGPRLPIMALTANASASDRDESLDAGVDGYLAKPFELAQLAVLLSDHLLPSREPQARPAEACEPVRHQTSEPMNEPTNERVLHEPQTHGQA